MTSDHIDRLQTELGPARFATLDALVAKPRTSALPPGFNPAEYARIGRYNSFFSRVSWLEDRAASLARLGKVGPLTRTAPAREFGLTVPEQALVTPIVADWQTKNGAIARQAQKLAAAGITGAAESPELQSVEAARQQNIADHIDRLQATLSPERFAALDALLGRPRSFGASNRQKLAVLDVDGKTVSLSFAGIGYEPPRSPEPGQMAYIAPTHLMPQHGVALLVFTPEGIEEFGWETITKVDIKAGRATIALRTGETVEAAELPSHSSLDGQTDGGSKAIVDFSRIKTITVSP